MPHLKEAAKVPERIERIARNVLWDLCFVCGPVASMIERSVRIVVPHDDDPWIIPRRASLREDALWE